MSEQIFHELITTPEDDEFIQSQCEVHVDSNAYFVTVETDSFEGVAMMTLPCAIEVHAALGRAIEAAKAARKQQ